MSIWCRHSPKVIQTLEADFLSMQRCRTMTKEVPDNSPELLEQIPDEIQEKSPKISITPDSSTYGKMLRIHWDTDTDIFHAFILDSSESNAHWLQLLLVYLM